MTKLARKIYIDLSHWDMSLWPDPLKKCVSCSFKKGKDEDDRIFKLTLDFNEKKVEAEVKKIAKDAIKAFFEDSMVCYSDKTLDIFTEGCAIRIPVGEISGPDGEKLAKPPRFELIELLREARSWLIKGDLPRGSINETIERFDIGLEDVGTDASSLGQLPKEGDIP